MSSETCRRIRGEVELIDRFAQMYRHKFSEMIEKMNAIPGRDGSAACLRVCVETVDMLLASHQQLARLLEEMSQEEKALRQAA